MTSTLAIQPQSARLAPSNQDGISLQDDSAVLAPKTSKADQKLILSEADITAVFRSAVREQFRHDGEVAAKNITTPPVQLDHEVPYSISLRDLELRAESLGVTPHSLNKALSGILALRAITDKLDQQKVAAGLSPDVSVERLRVEQELIRGCEYLKRNLESAVTNLIKSSSSSMELRMNGHRLALYLPAHDTKFVQGACSDITYVSPSETLKSLFDTKTIEHKRFLRKPLIKEVYDFEDLDSINSPAVRDLLRFARNLGISPYMDQIINPNESSYINEGQKGIRHGYLICFRLPI